MAKGDTTIKIDMEVAGASSAKLSVQDVFKTQEVAVERAANKQIAVGNRLSSSEMLRRQKGRALYSQWVQEERAKQRELEKTMAMEKAQGAKLFNAGKGALFGAASAIGLSSIAAVMQRIDQSAASIAAKREELGRAITPLSSLGDNAGNLAAIRKEVVQLAGAANTGTTEIGQFMFDLQSSTGNLSKEVRGELKDTIVELAEATGGDLVTAQNLMTKSYQISGKEVKNLTELSNKLMYTQEQAALRFEDLATRAPELLSAGKVVGVGMNEVMASIIGGTLQSGDTAKTMTGMRNVFLIMEQAEKKGITLTGSYIDKLGQLREQFESNSKGMQDLFGAENLAVAANLVDSIEAVKTSLAGLEATTGDHSIAENIIRQRLQDPVARMNRISELNRVLRQEAPNLAEDGAEHSTAARWARNKGLGALGAQIQSGAPEDSWTAWFGGWRGALGSEGLKAAGRRAEIVNVAPGPLRDVLLSENFEANKQEQIRQLLTPGGPGGMPFAGTGTGAAQLNQARASTFNVATESAKYPYEDPANTAATERNTKAMEDLTKAITTRPASLKTSSNNPNNLETL